MTHSNMAENYILGDSDNEDTSMPIQSTQKSKETHKKHNTSSCLYDGNVIPQPNFLFSLQQSFSTLREKNKPYIIYTLKEILSFTQAFAPIGNKIRIVGIYKENKMNLTYLTNKNDNVARVILDLSLVEKMPVVGQQIQVFGDIDFRKLGKSGHCCPIVVVRFWNLFEGDVDEFVSRLQLLQRSVSAMGQRFVEDIDSSYLENTTNVDLYFEELNDSVLNAIADEAEVLCEGINRLNVSEDLFK